MISLEGNKISDLKGVKFYNLVSLNLEDNQFKEIPFQCFNIKKIVELKKLNMARNQISL